MKVPIINAHDTTMIYLYYGYEDALPTSNGKDTFIFYDDFEDGVSNDWTLGNSQFVTPVETNGELRINGTGSGGAYWWGWSYAYTDSIMLLDGKYKLVTIGDTVAADWSWYASGIRVNDNQAFVSGIHFDPRGPRQAFEFFESTDLRHGRDACKNNYLESVSLGTYGYGEHKFEYIYNAGNIKAILDGHVYGERDVDWTQPMSIYHGANARLGGNYIDMGFKQTYLSKYASPYPTYELSPNEYYYDGDSYVCGGNCVAEPAPDCFDGIFNGVYLCLSQPHSCG